MEFVSAFLGLILVYFLQRFLYRHFWNVNMTAELKFSKSRAVQGETVILSESITNRKLLPVPMLHLRFKVSRDLQFEDSRQNEVTDYYNRNELFSLLMFQKVTRRLPFRCKKRGVYTIKTASLMGSGLLLSEEYLLEFPTDTRLIVYPKAVSSNRFERMFETMLGSVYTQRFLHEDPFSFRGIRDYQFGDPMKSINWKASAKTMDFKVNVLDFTTEQRVELYLNLDRETLTTNNEVLEESIRLAKTFAARLTSMGMRTALYTNGLHYESREVVWVEPGSGEKFLELANEALAKIRLKDGAFAKMEHEFDTPEFCGLYADQCRQSESDHYKIFISNYHRRDFQELLEAMVKQGQSVSWVLPVENTAKPIPVLDILKDRTMVWSSQWEGAYRYEG